MKRVATGLLIVMALVYIGLRWVNGHNLVIGYLRAFAEAGMVGGLADWFAVTALFRHPLGLPIPHTAIIPRKKDRIGEALAGFIQANFLTSKVIVRRLRRVDFATRIGGFLAAPLPDDGATRTGASSLAIHIVQSLDHARLGAILKGGAEERLRKINLAPMLGQALQASIADGRHVPMMNAAINWAAKTLDGNEDLVRAMVHERAGSVLRWTGLDENLSTAILTGLRKLLDEMATDSGHPMFLKAEEGLHKLAEDLLYDPAMAARIARLRDSIIANPAMRQWLEGLWDHARHGLLAMLHSPAALRSGALGETIRALGASLQNNARIRTIVNQFVRRLLVGIAVRYGDGAVTLVSDTIRSWDARTITNRLENIVGRDLQYIRLNGSLVGGLVGIVIHSIDIAAR